MCQQCLHSPILFFYNLFRFEECSR
jgi:hypothetical protein